MVTTFLNRLPNKLVKKDDNLQQDWEWLETVLKPLRQFFNGKVYPFIEESFKESISEEEEKFCANISFKLVGDSQEASLPLSDWWPTIDE